MLLYLDSSLITDKQLVTIREKVIKKKMSQPERKTVYLDYNATTPYEQSVKRVMMTAAEDFWGNPSSNYERGVQAKKLIEESRHYVAEMIEAPAADIIFISGGTECNNVAIKSVVDEWKSRSKELPHVISTDIEHDATLKMIEHLRDSGEIQATLLSTNSDGSVNSEDVIESMRKETVLVTLMMANNETGALMDLKSLCAALELTNAKRIADEWSRVYLHVDAAQAIGKVPVSVLETPVDYMTIVGHKFYGPRIGALYVKEGRTVTPLVRGGSQEKGRRPGTENTVCIAGLGEAARLVRDNIRHYQNHFSAMKEYLKTRLLTEFPNGTCILNFTPSPDRPQLPNTLSVSFPGFSGCEILEKCPELEASTGAACHSITNREKASKMLLTLLPERQAVGTIRLSVGRDTTKEDIDLAVLYLREAIDSIKISDP